MPVSIFKPKKQFGQGQWVISFFNALAQRSGPADVLSQRFGHAVLLLEGLADTGELSIYRCEIFAQSFQNYLTWWYKEHNPEASPAIDPIQALVAANPNIFSAIGETKVCYVSLKHYNDYPPGNRFGECTATSWPVNQLKIDQLLDLITQEKNEINANTRLAIAEIAATRQPNIPELFPLFNLYGKKSILREVEGINCVNWCEAKLKAIGIPIQGRLCDSLSAAPENHAGGSSSHHESSTCCLIL